MFVLLQLGGALSIEALLVGLLLLAGVVLVGRLVLKVAWRLVIIALVAATVLWVLGLLGFQVL